MSGGTRGNNKYGARRVPHQDHSHPSAGERTRCFTLHQLQERGEIRNLQIHPSYPLVVNGQRVGRYTADWQYLALQPDGTWGVVVEDFKSPATQRETAYRLRKRIFQAQYKLAVKETY